MPEKPRRSMSRAMSNVCRRRPGTATRLIAGSGVGIGGVHRCWSKGAYVSAIRSAKPLPELDMEPVGIADLSPRTGFSNSRAPDNVDPLLLQIVRRLLHVVDLERDHAVAEMLPLRRGIEGDAVIRDQLDDGA